MIFYIPSLYLVKVMSVPALCWFQNVFHISKIIILTSAQYLCWRPECIHESMVASLCKSAQPHLYRYAKLYEVVDVNG